MPGGRGLGARAPPWSSYITCTYLLLHACPTYLEDEDLELARRLLLPRHLPQILGAVLANSPDPLAPLDVSVEASVFVLLCQVKRCSRTRRIRSRP